MSDAVSDADPSVRIEACADDALLMTVADDAGEGATERVISAWRALRARRPAWLVKAQPAFTSLQVVLRGGADLDEVERVLRSLPLAGGLQQAHTHLVPVRYDGADLGAVAEHAGLGSDDVIRLHADRPYRCAFVGFLPGFPYLLGLDERLHMPRLATPRPLVPAGSVGIGGSQTGVYPAASPGGWRLLGTALMTFAPDWIEAGDIVVFRATGGGP